MNVNRRLLQEPYFPNQRQQPVGDSNGGPEPYYPDLTHEPVSDGFEPHYPDLTHEPISGGFEPYYPDGQPIPEPIGSIGGTDLSDRMGKLREGAVDAGLLGPLADQFGDQVINNVFSREVTEVKDHFSGQTNRYASAIDVAGVQSVLGDKWELENNYSGPGHHQFALRDGYNGSEQTIAFSSDGSMTLSSEVSTLGYSHIERVRVDKFGEVSKEGPFRVGGGIGPGGIVYESTGG